MDDNHLDDLNVIKKKIAKNLTCYYCGKKGHIEKYCFKRKRDAEQGIVKPKINKEIKEEMSWITYVLILSTMSKKYLYPKTKEKQIGNSGATVHITNDQTEKLNIKNYDLKLVSDQISTSLIATVN